MKNAFLATILLSMAIPASAQVGVSVGIGEPGFYGQISIENAPPPQVIYPQPVVIAPAPRYVGVPPVYLRVPPGQAEHWRDYCARYNACGRPVYFVRDDWYTNRYVPYYRNRHGGHHEDRRYDHRGHGDHDRGHGHGHDH